jgi:hypothetical protein
MIALILVLGVGFTGCAAPTAQTCDETRDGVPALGVGEGRIFFYARDYPFKTAEIKVDGETVGLLGPMRFLFVDLPSGSHEVMAARGHAGIMPADRLTLSLTAGEIRYVEMLAIDLRVRLVLIDPTEGQSAIRACVRADKSPDQ